MHNLSLSSVTLAALVTFQPAGFALAQTSGTALPPPGPYQSFTPMQPRAMQPQAFTSVNPLNSMPVPYWMQQSTGAPAANATVGPNQQSATVYPTAPQPRQQNRQFTPNFGWSPFGYGQQQGYGPANQPYGSVPSPFPFGANGPWGGFNGPVGSGYGYQPGFQQPFWQQN